MTVRPSMEDKYRKVRRAREHLEVFRDKVLAFKSLDSHTIVIEDDPDASQYVFKVCGLKLTDPDWGLIAGDCVHNLRTALDHLVFQLAILGQGGRELTEKEAGSCSFPIYDKPSSMPNPSKCRPIELLRSGEQTRIAELQPFNAWDASIWGIGSEFVVFERMSPARIPLMLERLALLDNIDKHRTVHATWRIGAFWEAENPPIPLIGSTTSTGPLEDEAEVGRWHYGTPKPELPPNMDMDRYFPTNIAFAELPPLYGAVEALYWLADAVGVVLELFRPCVEIGAAPLPLSTIPA